MAKAGAKIIDKFDFKPGRVLGGKYVIESKLGGGWEGPNMHLRDPVMYRIKNAPHHRTGSAWCIYPMYDWAHGQSDSIERVTHSVCTLEFEVHRPLYEWFIDSLEIFQSRQYSGWKGAGRTWTVWYVYRS